MIFDEISELLQAGKAKDTVAKVQEAIDSGIPAKDILEKGLLAGMNIVGDKFKRDELYVPEVLVAARAMNKGTALLKPLLGQDGLKAKGTVVIGTVQGDLHDIGKNLVRMMLEGKGLTVIDIGVDVPAERYIEAAIENNAQIIACSALLTTTMNEMKYVVEAVEKAGLRDKIKIMIGGAPVNQEYCNQIGADYYTPDAASAAEIAVKVLG